MKRLVLLSLAGMGLGGCGDDQPTYFKDVKPLVELKCQGCHVAGGIAPFTLTSYEDIQSHADKIRNAVRNRIMPPWPASPGCADYALDRSLTDAQIATFTKWLDTGLVKGDPGDYQAPQIRQVGLSRVDNTLSMPVVYTPQISPDDYRCFVIDWPYPTDMFVTGFNTKPGNASIVHHVIAFLARPEDVAAVQQLDDADPAPGYTCFGGPGGGVIPSMLGGWAPGYLGGDFPAGTGVRVRAGSKVVLQVHYNTLSTAPMPDQTSIEMKIDATVAKPAMNMFFTDFRDWIQGQQMLIPAGQPDVMYSFSADPTPYLSKYPDSPFTGGKPLTVYAAMLHQHLRGSRSRFQINHWGGQQECLLDIEHWNFHWQMSYPFAKPKIFKPGDEFYIECHWDNSQANQPWVGDQQLAPTDLNWGEGSTDEMCLGALYVTE